MSNVHEISRNYPSSWGQVYALAHGELCSILESIFDDTITVHEAMELYVAQQRQHVDRVSLLAQESVSAPPRLKPRA